MPVQGSPFQLQPARWGPTELPMGKPNSYRVPKARTTIALSGTTRRLEVKLDAASDLSINYARRWLRTAPGSLDLDVLASGVVRRSLEVYMQHLSSLGIDPEDEARAVMRRCTSLRMEQEDQDAALQRLQAHDAGLPLPPWPEVIQGPGSAAAAEALTLRAESFAAQLMSEKGMRLRLAQKRNTPRER